MTTYQYQKKCFKEYKESIKFPKETSYLYGNPVNTVVPVEAAIGQVMIIGSFPSAKLYFENGIPDVPLYDINAPFSTEPYFDGSRVRTSVAGQELNEVILEMIGVSREQCWITNLVKVFLFDQENVKRYNRLGKTNIKENRSQFMEYANRSLKWIRQELEIANPYAVILFGPEVISSLLLVSLDEAKEMMTGEVFEKDIIWKSSYFIGLPPPSLLMTRAPKNPWPLKFEISIGPKARKEIEKLKP